MRRRSPASELSVLWKGLGMQCSGFTPRACNSQHVTGYRDSGLGRIIRFTVNKKAQ